MTDYSSLHSSINSAIENYESYKSQSLRLKLENISLGDASNKDVLPRKQHIKRASMAMPSFPRLGSSDGKDKDKSAPSNASRPDLSSRRRTLQPPSSRPELDKRPSSPAYGASSVSNDEFREFITVAENYEATNFLHDLDFLLLVVDFMRSEHPYTSNSLQKAIKGRHLSKRKLWTVYTSEMQGLARAYSSGKAVPVPPPSSPLSPTNIGVTRTSIRDRKAELRDTISKLENAERTCADSILSALSHLHSQAIKDIRVRYSLPDPINDKTTSVEKHNERVRVFNQLIQFVAEDLRRLEVIMKASGQSHVAEKRKDKKGSGVVEAVESLQVEDYPPYGSK